MFRLSTLKQDLFLIILNRKSGQELTSPQPTGISKRINTFGRRMRNTFRSRTSSGLINAMELGARSEAGTVKYEEELLQFNCIVHARKIFCGILDLH